eukprot:gb/GFBE01082087.1/.p1 GENE.gb/GFBE01082087.1/~~gb/GFBE01082087.1/.p1  ORF type:complete len:1793 (+),score=430.45 gb/GFBE01082087.1/:1-5379(+)
MDVTVTSAQGLPAKAYLSLRAGDVRKQVQYKPGECFRFDVKSVPRHVVVDVFEKVGSAQVNLADLANSAYGGAVQLNGRDGSPIVLDMQVKVRPQHSIAEVKKPRISRHQAALEAQSYLEAHNVQKILQGMVHELLSSQPADPLSFMTGYIKAHSAHDKLGSTMTSINQSAVIKPHELEEDDDDDLLPDWAAMPGMGEEEYPGFASNGSQPLPNLKGCHSIMASVLRETSAVYEQLKDLRSSSGVTLAQCIKPGLDNKGHRMVRTLGLVAGDESCYDVFRDVFLPVKEQWHSSGLGDADMEDILNADREVDLPIDPLGNTVLSVQVAISRNLSGIRMPPAVQREERRKVERLLVKALLDIEASGSYEPLRGSSSYASKPQGMSYEKESEMKVAGRLLQEPQSDLQLSSGYGRHWPDARGVFDGSQGLVAWLNEEDHLKLFCAEPGADLLKAFDCVQRAERAIAGCLEASGHRFAQSERFGFLTACPTNAGAGIQASAVLDLPNLAAQQDSFKVWCRRMGLIPCRRVQRDRSEACNDKNVWEVKVARSMGMRAESVVAVLAKGCRRLVAEEMKLQAESAGQSGLAAPGTADTSSPSVGVCSEFSRDKCLAKMPDVSGRHSLAAEVLRRDPSIYDRLKDKSTPSGVDFATCVKTCFENFGHPMIKTVGAVAGDEACYDTFKELFDPIIRLRHPGYAPEKGHRTDLDSAKVIDAPLDATGHHVVAARVRVSRNLRGLRLPPACSEDERRAVEASAVQALAAMTADLKGEYFPLLGSNSHAPKPGGMSEEDEDVLREADFLFEEPDSSVLLSSGYARDWPDARGVFADMPRTLCVFVNELDHLRLCVSDCDLKQAFERLCRVLKSLEASLSATGQSFMWNERLGFLGSDPSQLGTCLSASVTVRIPLLSSQPKFRELCKGLGLQAQLAAGPGLGVHEGLWEVQNSSRLGSTEVEQVNSTIEAVRAILRLEERLENGEHLQLDAELRAVVAERGPADDELPGLGDKDSPGFPVDSCPAELPDLSRHHSLLAQILTADPAIYTELKDRRTDLGVSLARCIKSGIDNQGHSLFKVVGAFAGDAQCYDVFGKLFDPLILARHKTAGYDPSLMQPRNLNMEAISSTPIDGADQVVVSVQVSAIRNLAGHRFTPAMALQEREQVEKILSAAFSKMQGDFAGEYYPLTGSSSSGRLGGMSEDDAARLRSEHLLIEAPDAPLILSSGRARSWPKARGVFASANRELAAWINDEDHLRLFVRRGDADLKAAFASFCEAEEALTRALAAEGGSFARSPRLGFLTTCPSNLGTALRAKVRLQLPQLSRLNGFREFTWALMVQAKRVPGYDGNDLWDVSNVARLSSSEVDQVNCVIAAVQSLVSLERRAEGGEALDLKAEAETVKQRRAREVAKPRFTMQDLIQHMPGLGNDEVPGFPADVCPEPMPDLTGFFSLTADVLRKDPSIYERLRSVRTVKGVTFAKCIKPGMDNRGHPMIRAVGAVAGDAECYSTFRDLFMPIIMARQGSFDIAAGVRHPRELNAASVSSEAIDPVGGHVVAARIKISRNLAAFRFPSAVAQEERRTVEAAAVKVLSQLDGDLAGEYFPLRNSQTCVLRPQGMTEQEAAELEAQGLLFQVPDSPLVLSTGSGRHWPEARGIFANASKNLAVWVNEEDHLRFAVTAGGLHEAFSKICMLEDAMRVGLQHDGLDYACDEALGFLSSCPSKLGSGGLQASVLVKLPLLAGAGLKARCKELQVASRTIETAAWGNVWKISAVAKLGQSEANLVEQVASACRTLVAEEIKLERGSS